MNYSFDEFNPGQVTLEIPAGEIPLNSITLSVLTFFEEKYQGLQNIFTIMKEDPEHLTKILWQLVKHKERFDYSYAKFKDFFQSKEIATAAGEAYKVLTKLIADSMPLIKNPKRHSELLKIRKAQSDNQSTITCYGEIYDRLATRYGITVAEFYNLTLRQVHILLEKMEDGKYKELEVQAALLGRKLQPRLMFTEVSEEQEKENDQQALEAVARLRREYEEKKKAKEVANG